MFGGDEGGRKQTKADNVEQVWHLPNAEETDFVGLESSFEEYLLVNIYSLLDCFYVCALFLYLIVRPWSRGTLPYVSFSSYFV